MRYATLTLALAGLLFFGVKSATALVQPANAPTAPAYLTTVGDQPVVTYVHRPVYRPAPARYGYYNYRPYYDYRPRAYWYGPPRYNRYYAAPYPGYYYPGGFNFEFYGPRSSFGFGF